MQDQRKDLFELILKRVELVAAENGIEKYKAFGKWFSEFAYQDVRNIDFYDGAGDGKVDIVIKAKKGKTIVINSKYTEEYKKVSPPAFYDEITRFWQAFKNKENREIYLKEVVREELQSKYARLFRLYDNGEVKLVFLSNCLKNEKQDKTISKYKIERIYLDDLNNFLLEHLENAMPETDTLILSDISNVISASKNETEVPTSIVFARLVDFIHYMDDDPLDLLFARNVRLWLQGTETNKEILKTFKDHPNEFVYSNNGITVLCNSHRFEAGKKELSIDNPRVVNGSQTLHSIRKAANPSRTARVMVRIIEIPYNDSISGIERRKRKEIIHNISIRSNMQNPVKKWNLVANDDFQLELSRYFWSKHYYYERRQNEWKQKSKDLKNLKISKGIDVRNMMQILSCLYFKNKKLGPVVALATSGDLYDSDLYKILRETSSSIVFDAWQCFEHVKKTISNEKISKIFPIKKYISIKYHVFSLLLAKYSKKDMNIGDIIAFIEDKSNESQIFYEVEDVCKKIYNHYNSIMKTQQHDDNLSIEFSTYLKNNSYFDELLNSTLS